MRFALTLFAGLTVLSLALSACGDPNRSTYVRYVPAPNYTPAASASP